MSWVVHTTDCLEYLKTLPTGSVDAVVTDPPYADSTHDGARTSINKKLVGFSSITEKSLREVLTECGRVCCRWVVATMDWKHVMALSDQPPEGLRFVRMGVWVKTNGAPQFTGDRPAQGWEAIGYFHRADEKLRWNGGGHAGNFVLPKVNGKHPTTKPIPLVKKIVEWFTEESSTVLDPFCGSGTTGVACIQTGRNFVGCEIDPGYADIVHAEMEALLSCGRVRGPLNGGTVYTTTFPCHNCAKHVIAAGIQRLVFIEPYPKSKAEEFHPDAIQVGFANTGPGVKDRPMVHFEPFVGVGPRRFFDLFSLQLGSGYPLKRKDLEGKKLEWKPEGGRLRLQMLPASYLDLEFLASNMFNQARSGKKEAENAG